ncbi:MAG: L-seryl-tRNA(Sec) selenium transferase [Candidatus Subteraquimicrobiales bacterium]|nr:L-seryl-tRNA(Sec) selenium transferase [Candidatus Subteraquimicrobiales bacterium]
MEKEGYLRKISAVDEVLQLEEISVLIETYPREVVVEVVRTVLDELRKTILESKNLKELEKLDLSPVKLVPLITKLVQSRMSSHLKRVINATGVVIHTNLGRSILPFEAVDAITNVADNYSNLEFNLQTGERGSRYEHVEEHLVFLTGAEATMVVNNNAGAVLLSLSTLAKDKEVIVSRGELVEIGGSFRIPDVMRQSGAKLKEVGTTNKTYLEDYERAITPETALLLKVHTSNFRVVGFTASVDLKDLVALGKKHNLLVMEDLGSGVFVDLSRYGLSYEPMVGDSVKTGADIITFSGDKLLGGPQAGIIIGKKEIIDSMKKHPLARALRVDKLTLAGLEATLRLYFDPDKIVEKIPTLSMILAPLSELKDKARRLKEKIEEKIGDSFEVKVEEDISRVGGGALPLEELQTIVVSVTSKRFSCQELERKLREGDLPVIVRVKDDKALLDVRTIQPEELVEVASAFASLNLDK